MLNVAPWILWAAFGMICGIAEIFVPGFVLGLVGVAALITSAAAFFKASFNVQLLVFGISNIILFAFVRKLIYDFITKKANDVKTNTDALIGKIAVVTKTIKDVEKGEVKLGGEYWKASSDKEIETGKKVKVLKIDGNTLIVSEIKED
jgi:membrane protein implicated in regulation of membrane protease activity